MAVKLVKESSQNPAGPKMIRDTIALINNGCVINKINSPILDMKYPILCSGQVCQLDIILRPLHSVSFDEEPGEKKIYGNGLIKLFVKKNRLARNWDDKCI